MYNLEWQTIKGVIALFLIVGIGFCFIFKGYQQQNSVEQV